MINHRKLMKDELIALRAGEVEGTEILVGMERLIGKGYKLPSRGVLLLKQRGERAWPLSPSKTLESRPPEKGVLGGIKKKKRGKSQ